MSELKVYHCNEWHNEYTQFYLKSEADSVIKELEAQKAQAEDDCVFWKKKYNDCKRELDLLKDTNAFTMEADK